jgi:endonuclease/exonuclease/phosphatase family metal-dependent hydrolase
MKKNNFGCRFLNLAILCLAAAFLAGCFISESDTEGDSLNHSLVLMTWNVHNLFDGKDNGNEYDEFKEAAGWSTEKYLGRIVSLSRAIDTIEPRPDIILLQEVESLKVLEDLALSISGGYSFTHFANNPGAAVGLGILSRIPLLEPRVHSITINGETTPRPVLETKIHFNGDNFVVFTCHWKSKVGGDDATENVRKASARVILRRIRELRESEPELGIIIAGDLNASYDEFYKRGANIICALLPDDPYCAELTGCLGADSEKIESLQKDFIIISKNKPPAPVHFPEGVIVFYSPWTDDLLTGGELKTGTYFYRYNWETIDHFLLSRHFFNNTGLEYERAMVINSSHFVNANGIPVPYNVRTGMGLSDHLPLLLVLRMVSNK